MGREVGRQVGRQVGREEEVHGRGKSFVQREWVV